MKLRSTIKSALTYPVVVLIMAIVSVIGMLLFIVPIFEKMFADLGGELPLPTQILVILSRAMVWIAPVLLVGGIAFAIGASATSTRMPCAAGSIRSSCACPYSATCSAKSPLRASPATSQR